MKKSNSKLVIYVAVAVVVAIIMSVCVLMIVINNPFEKKTVFAFEQPASGSGTGYFRHCYEELNENEKLIYSVILNSVYELPERIEIPALEEGSDLSAIFSALSYDNPDIIFLGLDSTVYNEGKKTYFEAQYTMSKEQYDQYIAEIDSIVAAVVQGASSYTSTYEKELYVHDYIVNHCVYMNSTSDNFANGAYGCLVLGSASCEGYSRAFQLLLNKLDIDNRLVTGQACETGGTEYIGHMWNYVVIDSLGYFVDVTWDDPTSNTSILRHTYFNINSNDVLMRHRDIKQTIPLVTNTQHNYYVYENCYFTEGAGEAFEQAAKNCVFTSIQRGYRAVEMRFSDKNVMTTAMDSLVTKGVIYDMYNEAGLIKDISSAKVYYSTDDSMCSICLFF